MPVNRLLGLRSPIIDVEHQQLFSAASVRRLLAGAGLVDVGRRAIRNRYPLRYWIRLAPLPRGVGDAADRLLAWRRIGDRGITLPVGNLLAWGRKAPDLEVAELMPELRDRENFALRTTERWEPRLLAAADCA